MARRRAQWAGALAGGWELQLEYVLLLCIETASLLTLTEVMLANFYYHGYTRYSTSSVFLLPLPTLTRNETPGKLSVHYTMILGFISPHTRD